ncbi:protein-tyrosine phosphatase family protein [Bacillus ndiopicus]|uniref:protein-tyrosine phosphatase family protein n=1 Tax=Bacillus ndiopicus TaxID=1347368 RepID=UPI0005AA5AFC|nr:dual specificity protein phosphatase family protein [Bacillus ndiopicus]
MSYDELVKGRIYFGGAADTKDAVAKEKIDLVVDVRLNGTVEAANCKTVHASIEEQSPAESIKAGVERIAQSYKAGENIYLHCGSGGGRAGVMATAVLIELGLADNLASAERMVKEARPIVNIRPNMREALEKLYK